MKRAVSRRRILKFVTPEPQQRDHYNVPDSRWSGAPSPSHEFCLIMSQHMLINYLSHNNLSPKHEEFMMSKTCLVTGSARGLGRHIAEAVLAAGDNLVATARDPSRLSNLQDRYDDRIRGATLDVTDALAARTAVQMGTKAFEIGRA